MTCFLGHRWTLWGPPEQARDGFGRVVIQRKRCTICNKIKAREVTAAGGISLVQMGDAHD